MLSLKNVSYQYPSAPQLFHELSLALPTGSICGLLGKNGAGKTTLLKIMSGLIEPLSGQALWNDQVVFQRSPAVLAEIFFVTESATLPELRTQDFGVLCGKLYPQFSIQTYNSALLSLEIESNQLISKLSFGQRRKVHVAFGLATGAKLLVLDEPTNGFDIPAQTALRKTLLAHHGEESTIVISTHHIREFDTLLDRVIILDGGKILLNKTIAELESENNPLHLEDLFTKTVNTGVNK